MAASRVRLSCRLALLVLLLVSGCARGQVRIDEVAVSSTNVPREAVSQLLIESALNSLNERNTYRNSQLIEARKLVKSPYVIYQLRLKLEPACADSEQSCSNEICSLDVRQHEQGVINVIGESIKCDSTAEAKAAAERETIEGLERQVVKGPPSFDSEVQVHEDQNYRPFVAVRANQSEYCPGCPYELNPSLPGLTAFSEQALRSMDEAAVSDFKHKLVSIVRVSRAVPANANLVRYQLLMEIAESNCLKSSLIELSECSAQSNLPIKLCLVTFEERPWRPDSRLITNNNCTEQLGTADNEVSANLQPAKLGKSSEIAAKPVDEPASTVKPEFFDQIAQEAQEVARVPSAQLPGQVFQKTDNVEAVDASELPHTKPHFSADKLKEFDEFLQDFDAPVKFEATTVKDFGEPIDEEPTKKEQVATNSPKEEITEDKEAAPDEQAAAAFKDKSTAIADAAVETARIKRDLTQKPVENNKAMLRKLTVKAIELVDQQDDDDKRKRVIDVLGVDKERRDSNVVYYLTVEVAPTDCSEKDQSTECLDEVIIPGSTEICKISVATSEKKPLQSPKLLHYDCKYKQKSESRFKRENILGGQEPHDPEDPKIKKFIELGLQQYSANYHGTHEPMISKVRNVTVQVVSGLLYRIETDIGSSTCKKGETLNCQLNTEKESKQCIIEVWSQPWMDKGNPKIKVKCDQDKREKRSLRGVNYSVKMLQQSRQLKEEKLFHAFIDKYKRKYTSEEEKERRFNIFRNNLDMIEELQRNEQGTGRYGVTQFADLTKAEFTANYLGLKPVLRSDNDIPLPKAEIPDIELPENFDWRHYNVVTPVKNQGSCGSCWAFSVTGNVEGQYAIKHGKLLSLSEQELVDCDKLDSGCNGGLPDSAYRAIEELGGLELESDYPYEAEDEKCHFDKNKVKVSIVSGLNITSNETQMAQWLVQNGPMSIGINANAMQFYMGGVSHPFKFLCRSDIDSLDHGVLIVGYGIKTYPIFKKSMPYWLIKNSWGPHWGEQGYYRVYRGDGTCGVNQMVTSAVIA
ncbi:uncharacterized protein LOC131674363 [Phymastichus coffea]|uniref:uncharacterized protein LOC131674363 n=1 Tax=Phymastichus coffea TaxID=108790 RepID=UPI00273BA99C|nr:uncharacterized protein LOC131674363 [Phymastichus coffea]